MDVLTDFFRCSQMMIKMIPIESTPEYENLIRKGFILKSVDHEQGMEDVNEQVAEISIEEISESEFSIPADYTELSFTDYFRAQMLEDEGSDMYEDEY
jgi:hypothetical protein